MTKVSERMSNRFSWMSLACAVMVVAIHSPRCNDVNAASWWWGQILQLGVCQIAVPYFYVAAGYFLAGHLEEPHWWRREVTKRFRTLYVPYCLWNLLFVVFGVLLSCKIPACRHFLSRVFDCFVPLPGRGVPMGALWFVRALMVFVLLSGFLKRFATPLGLAALYVLWVVTYPYVPSALGSRSPAWFSNFSMAFFSTFGLFWFVLGIYLRNAPDCVQRALSSDSRKWAFLMGGGVILQFIRAFLLFKTDCWALMALCGNVSIPLLMLGVWRMMPKASCPPVAASLSFPIYLTHGFAMGIAQRVMGCHYGECLLGAFLFILATTCAIVFAVRKLPKGFVRLAFGGR